MDTRSLPLTENLGCLVMTSVEVERLISDGSCADEPSVTLGKAEIGGDGALTGCVVSNYNSSPSRVGNEEVGVQGGDEGGQVDCASDKQGINTPHQVDQSVWALTEVEIISADEGLGCVDSFSPLLTINPLELVVLAELNGNIEGEE
ncbi:hypothetical protein CMV_007427 [Castanea mollissima]|uniref:Uncharacterized protein n=1 Tax=Castanea mollissima TaxID=60419 RepID=A0A8J4RP41_9ROSI|nr:hypothetical protein CMV_007427 [Castanea mollissima]